MKEELIYKLKSVFSDSEQISKSRALRIIMISFLIMITVGVLLSKFFLSFSKVDTRSGNEKVLGIWQQEVEEQPKDFNALIQLALNLQARKEYDEALKAIDKAEKLNGSSWEVPFYRGLIYKAIGQEKVAKKHLEKVIKNYPQHYLAYFELGVITMEEEKYPEAIRLLEKAAKLSPAGDTEIYQNLGVCYQKQGMVKEAKMALQKALRYQKS